MLKLLFQETILGGKNLLSEVSHVSKKSSTLLSTTNNLLGFLCFNYLLGKVNFKVLVASSMACKLSVASRFASLIILTLNYYT
jgi:hypothetical protein